MCSSDLAAAERPRHLAAIAPWEGASDVYRDALLRGGIPDTEFNDHGVTVTIYGQGRTEDTSSAGANLRDHPLFDDYWADKVADVSRIEVPAYVLASWTNPLHTRGTLAAFRALDPARSWLRVHHEQEWIDFADPRRLHDLRRFLDRYLKDVDNDWEATPRVRLSVLDPGGHGDVVDRAERGWPLARARTRTALWTHAAILIAVLQAPFYGLLPQIVVLGVAAGICWREDYPELAAGG